MACVVDRDAAVREVAQAYELIKLEQPLLLLLHSQQPPSPSTTTAQLAQSLLGKALRALHLALSVMQQQPAAPAPVASPVSVIKAEPQLSPPSPTSPADSQSMAMAPRRGAKRRRSSSVATTEGTTKKASSSSWTTLTAVPNDDGYEWRKYGEKKIKETLFTRSYFRCTYKDDTGCLATKHVQQMDDSNSDQPMFHVIYNNHHTCNTSAKANTGSSCCDMKQEPTTCQHAAAAAAAAMNMKQEPPLLLPALVDLDVQPSACFSCDQMMPQCQQDQPLFPTSMEQQFVVCGALRDDGDGEIPSASATVSCIPGETSCWWDGYSGDTATAENDPLHDLERFLFMDQY